MLLHFCFVVRSKASNFAVFKVFSKYIFIILYSNNQVDPVNINLSGIRKLFIIKTLVGNISKLDNLEEHLFKHELVVFILCQERK